MNTTIAQQIADEGGVEVYLHASTVHKSLLRFLTCGSVDDGKSTPDWSSAARHAPDLRKDQLSSLHNDSKRHGTRGRKNSTPGAAGGRLCRRSASRALPLMSPIATSLPKKRKFVSPNTRGTSSTHP